MPCVWLPVSLLSSISRQLHCQPEQLLLHQRQGPNLLQEPQKPVSLPWLSPQVINGRFFVVFFFPKAEISGWSFWFGQSWILSSKVREANSGVTGPEINHLAISLMDLLKMLFVLCALPYWTQGLTVSQETILSHISTCANREIPVRHSMQAAASLCCESQWRGDIKRKTLW